MGIANSNVVSIGTGEVYKQIERFLSNKGHKSGHTSTNYERGIRKFFEIVKNKKIEFLTIDDVQIVIENFEDFRDYLKENTELQNNTINNYLSGISELLRHLNTRKINEEKIVKDISCLAVLNTVRLPEIENEYGALEVYELFNLLTFIEEHEENLTMEKFMFVVISADTMLRKSAVLNLKWDNIEVRKDFVIIRAIDKGRKSFRKRISHETYEKLLQLKNNDSDKIFNISPSTLQVMLNRFKKHFNIPKSRNIVIHSIRKCAAEELFDESGGDLMAVRDALGHSHVNTSQKYLNKDKSSIMGMFSRGVNYDKNLYKDEIVTHEMLIQVIDQLSDREKLLINKKLEVILNELTSNT